ncbi:hypothetical protein V8G54_003295 [Vigna mungo]|uniref:Uncharacterized protein n=1 Tax=Vigna mungo TaxID=3915 RepID=A0AAQ3SDM8_VIGMU
MTKEVKKIGETMVPYLKRPIADTHWPFSGNKRFVSSKQCGMRSKSFDLGALEGPLSLCAKGQDKNRRGACQFAKENYEQEKNTWAKVKKARKKNVKQLKTRRRRLRSKRKIGNCMSGSTKTAYVNGRELHERLNQDRLVDDRELYEWLDQDHLGKRQETT